MDENNSRSSPRFNHTEVFRFSSGLWQILRYESPKYTEAAPCTCTDLFHMMGCSRFNLCHTAECETVGHKIRKLKMSPQALCISQCCFSPFYERLWSKICCCFPKSSPPSHHLPIGSESTSPCGRLVSITNPHCLLCCAELSLVLPFGEWLGQNNIMQYVRRHSLYRLLHMRWLKEWD